MPNLRSTPIRSPSPARWFQVPTLLAQTDTTTAARGLGLMRQGKVLELDLRPANSLRSGESSWIVTGLVQGTQRLPYHVTASLTTVGGDAVVSTWNSDCTCPVGSDCKHGIALLVQAAQLNPLQSRPSGDYAALQASYAELQRKIAEEEADMALVDWLHRLETARRGQPFAGHREPGERETQFIYLLTPETQTEPIPRLLLEPKTISRKANGQWGKPITLRQLLPLDESHSSDYQAATAQDLDVLRLLRSLQAATYNPYGYSIRTALVTPLALLIVQKAAATGRLHWSADGKALGPVLTWGEAQSLQWSWQETAVTLIGPPTHWKLQARLPQAQLYMSQPPLYINLEAGLCGPVQTEGMSDAALLTLLQAPPVSTTTLQKHQLAILERLGGLPLPPVIEQPAELRGIRPIARLHLSPTPQDERDFFGLIQAQLRFDYQGHIGWWAGHGKTVLIDSPKGRMLLHRDAEAELAALQALFDLDLNTTEDGVFGLPGEQPQHRWLHWADNDFEVLREAGFILSFDAGLDGWITRADSLNVQMEPEGEDEATSPWFDLSLGMEINGQRHNILPWLPELLEVAASHPADPVTGLPQLPPYIYLPAPGGTGFIRLPTESLRPWLAALLELVGDRNYDFDADSLRLSRLDALRTAASLGEGAVWEGAAALRDMVLQLSGQTQLPVTPLPLSVCAELRPYQQQGLNWLQFLRQHSLGGILADDMGLGKTLQTLAHIQVEKDAGRLTEPALIIAPVSLMGNWQREAARFCPELRSLVLHGQDRHSAADNMAEHDLVIAPYSLLHRDRERWLQAQWHLVVLDEAQNIKNASTQAAQVVSQLQTRHRLCLSGTPMENHLGEIWSLFHFLMPGFLGSQQRFKTLFRTPIEKQADPERMTQLRARITPFMLRRTKALVAHELPPKIETVMRVELGGQQANLYETIRLGMEQTVRAALADKGLAKSQITILDALLKLRQVCCDPHLLKLEAAQAVSASAKLEQLMEMLPEMLAEGRRVLLFSQFTSMLSLIEAELKRRKLPWVKLTGQSQKRDELIQRFTSGEVPLFLISLKAGGVGLNLPQADTVIHYDPWWNPAVENQATDRAHRIGQTQSVWVVKLVAQGTIEERILALQERKAALADSMYSGAAARQEPLFTESDLAELLKPLDAG